MTLLILLSVYTSGVLLVALYYTYCYHLYISLDKDKVKYKETMNTNIGDILHSQGLGDENPLLAILLLWFIVIPILIVYGIVDTIGKFFARISKNRMIKKSIEEKKIQEFKIEIMNQMPYLTEEEAYHYAKRHK